MNGFLARCERACTKRASTSLPVPLSPVISTEASEPAICWASLTTRAIDVVAIDHVAGVVGDGREHRGDQIRIGRQRDVFLGAGMDGAHRGARVVADAAGDDRHMDALGVERGDQVADVDGDVDHQQVGAAAGAQHGERLLVAFGVGDVGALVHRDLARDGELAAQRADDEKAHGRDLLYRSALMISVMVTPSLSSTSTTSPRATSRLLT